MILRLALITEVLIRLHFLFIYFYNTRVLVLLIILIANQFSSDLSLLGFINSLISLYIIRNSLSFRFLLLSQFFLVQLWCVFFKVIRTLGVKLFLIKLKLVQSTPVYFWVVQRFMTYFLRSLLVYVSLQFTSLNHFCISIILVILLWLLIWKYTWVLRLRVLLVFILILLRIFLLKFLLLLIFFKVLLQLLWLLLILILVMII